MTLFNYAALYEGCFNISDMKDRTRIAGLNVRTNRGHFEGFAKLHPEFVHCCTNLQELANLEGSEYNDSKQAFRDYVIKVEKRGITLRSTVKKKDTG